MSKQKERDVKGALVCKPWLLKNCVYHGRQYFYYYNKNALRPWKSRKNLTMICCGFLSDHLLHILPSDVRVMNLLHNTLLPLENVSA